MVKLSSSLWLLAPTREFHVAPMQGYTHAPMRYLLRRLAPDAVLWTEMEKVSDLMGANEWGLDKRFGLDEEDFVLQLGGSDPHELKTCVQRICHNHDYRIRDLNLNCGCPSIVSGGASTYGASLMKEPELTRELLHAIREASPEDVSVSLKCRIGVVDTPDDDMEVDYERLRNYVATAAEAGISQVILHARPAVLSGLSPIKNRQVPQLDYNVVEQISAEFPELRVVLNGGIQSLDVLESLHSKYTHVNSFMAGRWILRRPLDLVRVQSYLESGGRESPDTASETVHNALSEYQIFLDRSLSSRNPMYSLGELCMPLYLVLEHLQDEDDFDDSVHDVLLETIQQLESNSSRKAKLAGGGNLKKMGAALKGLVGTKVFNKWKRNRAEL